MTTEHQKIGWSTQEWESLRNLAKQEINRVSKIKNLLSPKNLAAEDRNVKCEAVEIKSDGVSVNDRNMIPLVELSSLIKIDRHQIDATDKTAIRLAVIEAAGTYARALDIILLNGSKVLSNEALDMPNDSSVKWPPNCNITSTECNYGLASISKISPRKEQPTTTETNLVNAQELLAGFNEAKSQLQANGKEGPYILILSPKIKQAAVYPTTSLQLPITTLEKSLNSDGTNSGTALSEGLIVESSALDDKEALLFAPENIEFSWSYDGELQITNPNEPVQMRLYGAFALCVKNPKAVYKITYAVRGIRREKGTPKI